MTRFALVLLLLVPVSAAVQAQSGIVTGILRTDTGLPLEGVRVAVVPSDASIAESVLESQALTDSTGRYRLENVSPGRYNILIRRLSMYLAPGPDLSRDLGRRSPPMYHPGVAELDRATIIQVTGNSTIEVPDVVFAANVSGRVVDLATGKGRRVGNLVLCCDYSQTVVMGNGPVAAAAFTATLFDDGSFFFHFIPPGNYYLSAIDPAVIPVSWAIAVGKNGLSGLQLAVSEGVEVQGAVLDQTGGPVTARVQLRPKPTNSVFDTIGPPVNASVSGALLVVPRETSSLDVLQNRLVNSVKVQSDSLGPAGRFAFRKVYPGVYLLEVSTAGVTILEREIQVGNLGLTNISFQVPAIQVTGRVVASNGGPLPKLNYVRLVRSGTDSLIFYGFPDTEGRFSFLLVPGEYRVFTEGLGPSVQSVSDGSRNITNSEFTFEVGREKQIVVTLEP